MVRNTVYTTFLALFYLSTVKDGILSYVRNKCNMLKAPAVIISLKKLYLPVDSTFFNQETIAENINGKDEIYSPSNTDIEPYHIR